MWDDNFENEPIKQEENSKEKLEDTSNEENTKKKKDSNNNLIILTIVVFALALSLGITGYIKTIALSIQNSNQGIIEPNVVELSITGVTKETVYIANDISDIVENVMPSMVSITTTVAGNLTSIEEMYYYYYYGEEYSGEFEGDGSGIIIGKDNDELLILTNEHVITDATNIMVTFIDNTSSRAFIKGFDEQMDVAIISVPFSNIEKDTLNNIKIATLGDSSSLKLGQGVIAIGNALGYGETVTSGIISAFNRRVMDANGIVRSFIQTDAAINPGNSGGALLNANGEVIGINEFKIADATIDRVGFAIPISDVLPIIKELSIRKTRFPVEDSDRGYLGVSIRNVSDEATLYYGMPSGVFVVDVFDSSKRINDNGFIKGDIIVNFDGINILNIQKLQELLSYYKGGEKIEVLVYRYINGEYILTPLEITLIDNESFNNEATGEEIVSNIEDNGN